MTKDAQKQVRNGMLHVLSATLSHFESGLLKANRRCTPLGSDVIYRTVFHMTKEVL